jgi:hypothetical protein
MGWTLEFVKVGGDPIGRVSYDGSKITADNSISDVVHGYEPDELLKRFDGWSNGYVQSRKVA